MKQTQQKTLRIRTWRMILWRNNQAVTGSDDSAKQDEAEIKVEAEISIYLKPKESLDRNVFSGFTHSKIQTNELF